MLKYTNNYILTHKKAKLILSLVKNIMNIRTKTQTDKYYREQQVAYF